MIDLTNQTLHIRNELDETNKKIQSQVESKKKLRQEIEHWKSQFNDMHRTERTVRMDLDECKRAHEKFRNAIVQSIYTTPGVASPTVDTTEEEILKEWKKISSERASLLERITVLNQTVDLNAKTESNLSAIESLLTQVEAKLATGRRSAQISAEIALLNNLNVNEPLHKLKVALLKVSHIIDTYR